MLKMLMRDSLWYGLASVLQKLIPFLVIPLVISRLGSEAFKAYDVCFLYAILVSWLIVVGQDNAASILYFDAGGEWGKPKVLLNGMLNQLVLLVVLGTVLYVFRDLFSAWLFNNDPSLTSFWPRALWILPGQVILNYCLNILIWEGRKVKYLLLCIVQVVFTLALVYLSLVFWNGSTIDLFTIIVGVTGFCASLGLYLVRHALFTKESAWSPALAKQMLLLGAPFALTSFFQQALPSVDRYFLLHHHFNEQLPVYALGSKMSGVLSVASGAFIIAFTPYSMKKIHEADGERELSLLFRFVSVAALVAIPVILLFKGWLLDFFADDRYSDATYLLPFFFFAWVFDLFSYFWMLAIYRSRKSHLVLLIFLSGLVMVSVLNSILVPRYGIYGAAISLCITKFLLFIIPMYLLRKYFIVEIHYLSFMGFLALAVGACWLILHLPVLQYVGILAIIVLSTLFYLRKLFEANRRVFTYT